MLSPVKITHVDTAETDLASLTYYPIYTHSQHVLSKDWVKIPASIIKKLHVPSGWEASHPCIGSDGAAPTNAATAFPLYHYLNHPLPYIQLCGVVIDMSYSSHLRAWVVQLDDSSGQLMDVLIKKCMDPDAPKQQMVQTGSLAHGKPLQGGDVIPMFVLDWFGRSWAANDVFDIRTIEIGSILRVKGRLSPWKKGCQLLLERFDLFRSTSQEVKFWNQMTEDFNLVLCKPWSLTTEEQERLKTRFNAAKIEREKYLRKQAKKARKTKRLKNVADEISNLNEQKQKAHQNQLKMLTTSVEQQPSASGRNNESSDAHPIKSGLAPSYQVPNVQSSSTKEASRENEQRRGEVVLERSVWEPQDDPVDVIENASVYSGPQMLPLTGAQTPDISDRTTPALVDMSSAVYWKALHLTSADKSTTVSSGSAWVDIRASLRDGKLKTKANKESSINSDRSIPSITQQWDDLDI